MSALTDNIRNIEDQMQRLQIERMLAIQKAAESSDPDAILTAAKAMEKIKPKEKTQPAKAFFIDPLQFNANLGYKDKPFSLSYTTLKKMAKVPIINSIIKTRKNQIADFAEPQNDRYSTGFIIRKKSVGGVEQKMTEKDKKVANALTDFILNCGGKASWTNDDFDTFIRKIVDDSLTYDQLTFECIRNRKGQLESFIATDAATFRMAESAFRKDEKNPWFERRGSGIWVNSLYKGENKEVNGYYPQYVQVYQTAVVNEFYPWELCFGVRNPSSSIYANGYGCSELEELINVVTAMLWGDEYNRRFFSQGSAPKGLLRIKTQNGGQVNEAALQQFKQQWQAMISGVMQSWKTPVVEADVDWIDLQKSNRDMEYNNWMEYLIKLACAIYSIDPSEIGWDISRGAGNSGLFEGSQAERLQHSKDKGLYPILKFIQRKINKYIIEPLNPEFEFLFMGLNGMTIEKELEMDIKKLNNFATIDEIRAKWDMPELGEEKGGDLIENSVWYQNKSQQAMQAQQQGMGGDYGDEGYGDYDDGGYGGYEDEENGGEEEGGYNIYEEDEEPTEEGNEDEEQEEADETVDESRENNSSEKTNQEDEESEEQAPKQRQKPSKEETEEEGEENSEEDEEKKKREKGMENDLSKAFDAYMNKLIDNELNK